MEVYNHIYSPIKSSINKKSKERKFKYLSKKKIGEKIYLLCDIIYFCFIFFLILVLLLSPITYMFTNSTYVGRSKISLILEIVIQVILTILVIYIAHLLAEKLDVFQINIKNHHELRKLSIHAVTSIGVISMHVILQSKIEYLFGGETGFFGSK